MKPGGEGRCLHIWEDCMKESKDMAENSALDKVRVVGSEERCEGRRRYFKAYTHLQYSYLTSRPGGQESVHQRDGGGGVRRGWFF